MRSSTATRFVLLVMVGVAAALAPPAWAYSSSAAATIAARIPSALPPAARWVDAWSPAAAAEVERILAEDESDPEGALSAHRYVAGSSVEADPEAEGRVVGIAPQRLADAVVALEHALRSRQASSAGVAMAQLAIAAADLGDPFLTSNIPDAEVPGIHARFSDDLDAAELLGLEPRVWSAPADPLRAGAGLAERSAAVRAAVEQAALAADDDRLRQLRSERLGESLALAQALVLAAWRSAGEPDLEGAAPRTTEIRAWPNPARGGVTLAFMIEEPGPATVGIHDIAGRRVVHLDLGWRSVGPQEIRLGRPALGPLAPGVYLVRVAGPRTAAVGSFVLGIE